MAKFPFTIMIYISKVKNSNYGQHNADGKVIIPPRRLLIIRIWKEAASQLRQAPQVGGIEVLSPLAAS